MKRIRSITNKHRDNTMPVVKQVTYYSFEELSEQAQQRVIDKVREWDDRFLSDEEFILQDFRERHPHIHQMDIRYSGFWSQVSTQLEDMTWADYIEENDRLRDSMLEQHYDEIVDVIEEYRLELCHTLYRELERAYEEHHSEENIAEFVMDNDYLFDINGNFE